MFLKNYPPLTWRSLRNCGSWGRRCQKAQQGTRNWKKSKNAVYAKYTKNVFFLFPLEQKKIFFICASAHRGIFLIQIFPKPPTTVYSPSSSPGSFPSPDLEPVGEHPPAGGLSGLRWKRPREGRHHGRIDLLRPPVRVDWRQRKRIVSGFIKICTVSCLFNWIPDRLEKTSTKRGRIVIFFKN